MDLDLFQRCQLATVASSPGDRRGGELAPCGARTPFLQKVVLTFTRFSTNPFFSGTVMTFRGGSAGSLGMGFDGEGVFQ